MKMKVQADHRMGRAQPARRNVGLGLALPNMQETSRRLAGPPTLAASSMAGVVGLIWLLCSSGFMPPSDEVNSPHGRPEGRSSYENIAYWPASVGATLVVALGRTQGPPLQPVFPHLRSLSASQAAQPRQIGGSTELPPCIVQSTFSKNLPKDFHWPDPSDPLRLRALEEYGSIFVARGGVVPPPVVIFPDRNAVARWQSTLSTEQAEIAGIPVRLQSAALRALMKACEEALQAHVGISPRSRDAAERSFEETLELWRSRVNPGLEYWVAKGLLSAAEANRVRKLPVREQTREILELEKRGLYFSKDFSKSILFSVAPPGASQHISMLAFDVKEYDNPTVRSILEHHGWFQTVRSDLPHFTYLGVDKHLLPSLGLKMVRDGGREFWIPDLACPSPANH